MAHMSRSIRLVHSLNTCAEKLPPQEPRSADSKRTSATGNPACPRCSAAPTLNQFVNKIQALVLDKPESVEFVEMVIDQILADANP